MIPEGASNALSSVLTRARDLGFLGPGAVHAHVEHAASFAAAHPGPAPSRVLDLGSGGGVPGLPLALLHWPAAEFVLLEASERRASFLDRVADELGLAGRVTVCHARAEEAGREPAHRGSYDSVVSRLFGGPAVVAECGAPFLALGGFLLVSEPPSADPSRWPAEGLATFGLVAVGSRSTPVRAFQLVSTVPARFPRRVGVPTRRPLF